MIQNKLLSHQLEAAAFQKNCNSAIQALPRITAIGTGLSGNRYTQEDVLTTFNIEDKRVRSLFKNSSIQHRHLTLPSQNIAEHLNETQGELLHKHTQVGIAMGRDAIARCLERANADVSDIRHICCVSSTGFLTPGFSALLIKDMGLRRDCSRLDIVGMGCNAGLNALSAVSAWASVHPQELALLVCIEVCSAAYVFDGTMRSAVVNSLFGDGAAAIAVTTENNTGTNTAYGPSILRLTSYMIPEEIDAMRYEWNDEQGKFSFFLATEIPYLIGAHAEEALRRLLQGTDLHASDIKHWIVHSGGKKVIDSVRINLGLTRYDLRHTIGVLRDHGNMSSGSFLFSYERLLQEGVVNAGDYGVMMTMGPGATIEMALLHWKPEHTGR